MSTADPAAGRYATLPRRVQAMVVDVAVLSISFAALALAIPGLPEAVGPIIWWAAVLLFILYEPVLVSRTGGTVGHHVMNLRVQGEASSERIGFWRALVRVWIKGVLGIVSFVSMLLTRRYQAVHDALTRSVVVIHDVAKARPSHYLEERLESVDARVSVTRLRRLVAIVLYSALIFALASVATLPFVAPECFELDRCTPADDRVFEIAGLVMVAGICIAIVAGWKGELPGARSPSSGQAGSVTEAEPDREGSAD